MLNSQHFDTKHDNNQFILDNCIFKVNNYYDYYKITFSKKSNHNIPLSCLNFGPQS